VCARFVVAHRFVSPRKCYHKKSQIAGSKVNSGRGLPKIIIKIT